MYWFPVEKVRVRQLIGFESESGVPRDTKVFLLLHASFPTLAPIHPSSY